MMRNHLSAAIVAAMIAAGATMLGAPEATHASASNGVYGGYVGSDAWFSAMTASARNQAMLRSLSRGRTAGRLPPGYVEFAGQVVFPHGNPFPGKRLPDLRIQCRDPKADSVERAPYIDPHGAFYTVFKRGQTYDLYWMYYFGGREKFATLSVKAQGPTRRKAVIPYAPKAADSLTHRASRRTERQPESRPAPEPAAPPTHVDEFDLSGFPQQPTNFEEQQVAEAIRSATTSALKADAHERLARYYEKRDDNVRARAERAKADYWRRAGSP